MKMDNRKNKVYLFTLLIGTLLTSCGINTSQYEPENANAEDKFKGDQVTPTLVHQAAQYPMIQRDSLDLLGFRLGTNINSFLKHAGRPRSNIYHSDPYWFDRTIDYADYKVYFLNDSIVGFKLLSQQMSYDMIKRIGITDSILEFIYNRSKLTPQNLRVNYVPVYHNDQQLDEGLDFEFYEDGRVLFGYSSK
jgi:hypothetical protein